MVTVSDAASLQQALDVMSARIEKIEKSVEDHVQRVHGDIDAWAQETYKKVKDLDAKVEKMEMSGTKTQYIRKMKDPAGLKFKADKRDEETFSA